MIDRVVHEALMQPAAFPEPTTSVEFRETHVSCLYLTEKHVYKVKKPVDFGFLNFTSLDRRRFYCQEEVRLNRRFAPDTYLGVVEIRRTAKGIRIGGEGELLDYAVWMKRLPEERMLDVLLARDADELPDAINRLAPFLARIEQEAEICRDNGGMSNLEAVHRNWRENFDQIGPFAGHTLDQKAIDILRAYVENYLSARGELFRQRETDGFVRDGHGDLHAEHICLTEPIRIYDCIEFNRRFRVADTLADLAFLLMDLEFRGFRDLARQLLAAYRKASGEAPPPPDLLTFYKVYRAFVRGKVDSFLSADEKADGTTRAQAARLAKNYFNLGLGYLAPPFVLITCGLMGSGKSTLAKDLAWATGADLLRSDRVRKELAGLDESEAVQVGFGQGIYSPRWSRRTYQILEERAQHSLSRGRAVIIDAAFGKAEDRRRFAMMARRCAVPMHLLRVECPQDVLLQRLAHRKSGGADPSDGRPELLARQQKTFEWPENQGNTLCVDSTNNVARNAHLILCELLGQPGVTP